MLRLLVVLLSAACARIPIAPVADRKDLPPPVATIAPDPQQLVQLEEILAASGLTYVTVEAGRMWMIGFAPERGRPVMVHVVRGDAFTLILGRLGSVPVGAGESFYRLLARRNFEVPQMKLGLDAQDGVYAAFEVPSRLVDREELLADVFTLARTMDELRTTLLGEETFEPASPPPSRPPLLPSPGQPTPIFEAMR